MSEQDASELQSATVDYSEGVEETTVEESNVDKSAAADDTRRCGKWCPGKFSKTTLVILMLAFFLASCISAVILTNQGYSSQESQDWIMVGGLEETGATFRIRRSSDSTTPRLVISTTFDLQNPVYTDTLTTPVTTDYQVDSITVTNILESDTTYHYATVDSVTGEVVRQGRFQTPPPEGERRPFKFATAGCAMTGSQAEVFTHIRDENALFFLHLGDFHYQDIDEDDVGVRIQAIDRTLSSSTQSNLFTTTGLAYMWDDHDWLGNNRGAEGVGRDAALENYRLAFPYYEPLSSSTGAVYHAFTIGTVRFVISDLRSESTSTSMYSEEQRDWLFGEIAQADQYDFLVWVTPIPWIGPYSEGKDNWMGRPVDRQELSNHITETLAETQNLLAISADAHMLAFDDGSNTYYGNSTTSTAPPSFPILQSGPLDNHGSTKGGPYTDGCTAYKFETTHQYSTVEFEENGEGEPCLQLKSYNVKGKTKEQVFSRTLCGQIFTESNPGQGRCEEHTFYTSNMALGIVALILLVGTFCESCLLGVGRCQAFVISLIILILLTCTVVAGIYIPNTKDINQFSSLAVMLIAMLQMLTVTIYLLFWIRAARKGST